MTTHVTLATEGRVPLALGWVGVLRIVRAIAAYLSGSLILFSVVDDHLHVCAEFRSSPALGARDLRRVVGSCLRPGVVLQRAHVRPVESRAHLERLVSYFLRQPRKHGLAVHPALWPGSCFTDLMGDRLLSGFDAGRLRQELPRLKGRELMVRAGLRALPLEPAPNEELASAGLRRLIRLAADVFGRPVPLLGMQRDVLAARRLAVAAAIVAGFRSGQIAQALGVGTRTVRRAAQSPPDDRAMIALRRRLTLESRILGDQQWSAGKAG